MCLETKACCRGPVGARDANRFPTTSTLWPVFVPEKSETSIDKILVDGADAVALGRFSLVVKADGRHLSKLVAFHFTVEFTVELGTWSGCTCTRTPTWSLGP